MAVRVGDSSNTPDVSIKKIFFAKIHFPVIKTKKG